MQRDIPDVDIPPWAKARRVHLGKDFVKESIKSYLVQQGYEGDIQAAAARIEEKCRTTCRRG